MSSDDDEELRSLRATRDARSAAGGNAQNILSGGMQMKGRSAAPLSMYFADGGDDLGRHQQEGPSAGTSSKAAYDNDEDEDDDEDEDAPTVVDDSGVGVGELYTDELRGQFPMSFGEQEKKAPLLTKAHEANKRSFGPPRPPGIGPSKPSGAAAGESSAGAQAAEEEPDVGPKRPPDGAAGEDSDEDEDDEEDEPEDPYNLPISHEVQLKGHTKMISAMAVDRTGARALTGSLDYTVHMWDFGGMKSDMRSFRKLEPSEGHPVLALDWSPSGESFLAVTGSACPKVYDRDGRELGEFPRGDMYIRDMKNTKGHISGCTGGAWHPTDRYTAMTSSEDGSVRLWDCEKIAQKTVIKPQLAKPGRVGVTTCAFSHDGNMIGAGLRDGTIQLWSVKGKFGTSANVGLVPVPKQQLIAKQTWNYVSRPNHLLHKAHDPGSDITSMAFSKDGNTLLTRGADETLKVWDVRKLKQPVKVFADLATTHANTMCGFSPDERLLLTGVSAPSSDKDGGLVMFDRERLEFVRQIGVPGSVCAFDWHPLINQIFVGSGGRKSGATHVLYSPAFSEKGALRCVGRAPRKAMPFDFQAPLVIHNPHALPMFKEDMSRKRQKTKDRLDPVKSKKPDMTGITSGPGRGGKVGATGGTLLTQHLLKQAGNKRPDEQMDTRESILRHATEAASDPKFFGSAYADTQPKAIYAPASDDEEEGK